ncbi:putative mucin-7 precursor protein [Daldinia childiae]|uniref:putative mucin-7 precursor protein n=1 Tax=Daldinia childiae TaxID=326645 RepID=UPI001444E93A|nr:putative mucin-7 precursor protein [Daldinia childiae]KAF3065806.1 putative mucin-7 precursor protein [Daldinia childiae]
MSGVRNLRAMFEQKGENTPPDRGRSPGPSGISVGSPSPSHSPRPLSKVRTTFVAIEKDGRVGLRREPSGDSVSVSSRRLSDETDASTPQPVPEKPEVLTENMAKNVSAFKTNLSEEPIPESPIPTAPPKSPEKSPEKSPPKKESRSPALAPNPNPDKVTDEEETKTKLLPGNPTEKSVSRGSSVAPASGRTSVSTNGSKTKTTTTTSTKPAPKAISTAAKSVTRAPKSPNTLKPTGSTTKVSSGIPTLAPQKKSTPASSRERDAPKKTATTTTTKPAATSNKKPAPIDLPPSGAGFVKPKPKSPTRPIKLPSSLTAPTASSASKLGNGTVAAHPPRQSLSRASGNAQHLNVSSTAHRSPSRQSLSGVSTTSTAKGLKRGNSAGGRARPSLGLPPKPVSKDHPIIKRDGHVDESFLARMMRPTQSSSSKTAEKVPVTPPRKQSTPSSVQRKAEGSAKKSVTRAQSATNRAKAAVEQAKPAGKKSPTAKEVAPVVAQTETAEVAIETAKVSTDTFVEESIVSAEKSPEQVATIPTVTEDPEKVEDVEDLVQDALEPAAEIYAANSETEDVKDEQSLSEGTDEVVLQSEAANTTEEVKAEEESKVEAI